MQIGNTPLQKIIIEDREIWLKREDLNPSGSFKDRGNTAKLAELRAAGVLGAVIASSGNAAISILYLLSQQPIPGFTLHIVVSPNANPAKLERIKQLLIEQPQHTLHLATNAKTAAAQLSVQHSVPNIRSAWDDALTEGYNTLGDELKEQGAAAIFIPVSSGTAATGMTQHLSAGQQLHVCQTTKVHTIAEEFDQVFEPTESSLADSIVDKSALRKPMVVQLVRQTGGSGWICSDANITEALRLANAQLEIPLGPTSGLAVASAIKAIRNSKQLSKIICICSGR